MIEFAVLCQIVWLATLFFLCQRRDIDIHDKVSWIVAVLVFNVLGALVYLLFGPKSKPVPMPGDPPADPESIPVDIPGHSWNPILGENTLAEGQGLNPKKQDIPEASDEDTETEN